MSTDTKKKNFFLYNIRQFQHDSFFIKTARTTLIFTSLVILLVMSFAVWQSIKVLDHNISTTISSISYLLSQDEVIEEALQSESLSGQLRQTLDEVIASTEYIDIITIADNNSIRLYHPEADRIGKKFQGGDEHGFSDKVQSYLTTGQGTLGKQRRAFSQVRDRKGNPLGFVMVSSLTSNIYDRYLTVFYTFIPLTLLILAAAFLISCFLAYEVRRSLLGHNPAEFVRIFIKRNEIFDALEEGILATNAQGQILFVNRAAAAIYHQTPMELQGQMLAKVLPDCRLLRVLETQKAEYNREVTICEENILCDRIPLFENGELNGALCIYRNKTEVTRMAEELTGVKHIIEALRSNMHEFKNHLHIILGMLQLKEYALAEQYINGMNMDSMMYSTVVKCIENKTLAALVYGKIGQAREQGIIMTLESESYLPAHNRFLSTNQLVTILGNLLQNSIDAFSDLQNDREIVLTVSCNEKRLKITVDDSGCGIPKSILDQICTRGFSTKGPGRGIGMDLINTIVQDKNATMIIDSEEGEGTTIMLEFF